MLCTLHPSTLSISSDQPYYTCLFLYLTNTVMNTAELSLLYSRLPGYKWSVYTPGYKVYTRSREGRERALGNPEWYMRTECVLITWWSHDSSAEIWEPSTETREHHNLSCSGVKLLVFSAVHLERQLEEVSQVTQKLHPETEKQITKPYELGGASYTLPIEAFATRAESLSNKSFRSS